MLVQTTQSALRQEKPVFTCPQPRSKEIAAYQDMLVIIPYSCRAAQYAGQKGTVGLSLVGAGEGETEKARAA